MLKSQGFTESSTPERAATGRPRKLTREEIVNCAIALVEKRGPKALTMRALGKALGVQASTLYNYFPGVDQINQEISQRLLAGVPIPDVNAEADARTQLIEHFVTVRTVLIRHPEVLDRRPGSVSWMWSLRRLEAQLALFEAAGITPEKATTVIVVLDGMCMASAQVAREWASEAFVTRRKQILTGAKPGQFPRVAAAQNLLVGRLPDEQSFRDLLETLIDSLLPELRVRRRKA